ncbi:alpha/beta hydrolase [Microbacterium protaetiae]|uniref:Alpha/beta hydrolase n=1 Tax=Microbacterium protaetiae TaxID=2509458 RepID=A0A4P6EDV1_9MICO|nr:alpha/beta hydrolase [Microbacterium protaetiae]QAY60455.1 alpha/beta hydrolase [Microbacterium protaetiae]
MSDWQPDILGPPFEQKTLVLGRDDEGPIVATLVRSIPRRTLRQQPLADVDVLSVHGWSDYFFQPQLAQFFTARGARFHALDLRKYGRSLRPGQTPGDVASLDDYDADIGAALREMGQGSDAAPRRRLVLLGHSTGGLVLALWSARHPGRAKALVLNSPWLELQLGAIGRNALAPLVNARARVDPRGLHPVVDFGFYTRAQREVGVLPVVGYRQDWRPERGFRVHAGWLAAILEGHRRVAAGVEVGCPALVLLSARSTPPLAWSEQMTTTDSVLVVDDIAKAATRIGRLVTIARIDGALHDVFLSRVAPRAQAYAALEQWLVPMLRAQSQRAE